MQVFVVEVDGQTALVLDECIANATAEVRLKNGLKAIVTIVAITK